MPSPGEIVAGRYAIIREAGRGGMSVVYEAADLKLGGKRRAVKAMKPGTRCAFDAGASELEVLLRIDHPRLPQVIDVIPPADGGSLMIVTDYVHGEPLTAAFAREGGRMDARRAAAVAAGVCEALAYLHDLHPPVVHLDVKPSNVMLDPSSGVRLIDFGIARLLGAGSGAGPRFGTPGFAAPEQAAGGPCGPAADVYAAGALLYWLLSGGNAPKPGERDFRRLEAGVPEPVLDLLARMLSREPACRPSARRAAAVLAQTAGGDAARAAQIMSGGAQPSAGPAKPRPLFVAVASFSRGAGATMLSALLAALVSRRRPTALVEVPGSEPELLALLAGGDAFGAPSVRSPLPPVSRRHVCWLAGPRLQVHALHPDQGTPFGGAEGEDRNGASDASAAVAASLLDPERFAFPDASDLEPPIVITDLSSGWIRGIGRAVAATCDMLLVVADPSVWRWTRERLSAWRELSRRRESAGLPTLWIANQDARFPQRSAWIRLLPQPPAAFVPQLEPGEWPAAAWSESPLDGGSRRPAAALRSLEAVAERLLNG